MAIVYATACSVCNVDLSGGIDTFGSHDKPLCSTHWFLSILGGSDHDQAKQDVVSLIEQIDEKESEIEDMQFELANLEADLTKAYAKFAELYGKEYHTMFDDNGNAIGS